MHIVPKNNAGARPPSLKALPSRGKGVAQAASTGILFLILLVLPVNPNTYL